MSPTTIPTTAEEASNPKPLSAKPAQSSPRNMIDGKRKLSQRMVGGFAGTRLSRSGSIKA